MHTSSAPVSVLPPTFEQHHDGFGVHCSRPRISWRFSDSSEGVTNWTQTAYEIEISERIGVTPQVFKVESPDSVLVPWPSPETLCSRTRRQVRVKCHGSYTISSGHKKSSVTEWSPFSILEISLLHNSDWGAHMITVAKSWPLNPDGSAIPLSFVKSFTLPVHSGKVERARLYITSHGTYLARINDSRVGNHCLSPGWQSYHKRLHYQVFDIGHLLRPGSNDIQIEVASGWFASAWTWASRRFIYGSRLGVLAQLEAWYTDAPAPATLVATDDTWGVSRTALASSEIYNGEFYDQRRILTSSPGEVDCFTCEISPIRVSKLISPDAPPVRVVDRIAPKEIFKSRSGNATIVDFGQNLAGRVCVRRLQKPNGSCVTFRHAEVIQDGEIQTRPLRSTKATDTLLFAGLEVVDWHPAYTFHGFRFVEITGWSADDREFPLTDSSIVAEVLQTDMARTGWFSCSDEDVSRLHENSLWSMRSNFLSVPTECPSRDERMGWTGDLNLFAPTANFLYDTTGMLRNWLQDLYEDQMEESPHWRRGVVPLFIPNCLLKTNGIEHGWDPMPNGVWGDASVMVPWELYQTYGDVEFLEAQFQSMLHYLEHGITRGKDGLWDPEQWQFGDWLDPRAPQNDSGRGTTDGVFVADCFLIASTGIVVEVARLLGKPDVASRFQNTSERLVQSWRSKYLTEAGLILPDTATAISLALSFNLLPDSDGDAMRHLAVERLARIIRLNDFKITSGFVGTAYLPQVLTDSGKVELAYAMLFQRRCPSYLYPVTMGATTTWERWDSMFPDGSVNPGSMTSFNHHALGSIAHWLHVVVGGLEAMEPGWRVFRVQPWPNVKLTCAATRFESKYGRIAVKWTLKGNHFSMWLQVPPNSKAIVSMPGEENERCIGSGKYRFESQFVQTNWPPKALLPPWGRAEF
ncbi:uncharacterized protein E0L32_011044 [Thyridium curvatum]|uniref:alpha-L-rhamnosidase n=1 Tax=Thyridium curvatum TaxID=1093900 RepID=A0A507AKY9_9PEZI|nr:uncharacterized protein E0L32_011044 [Thyridium curvatum]TPX07056.1 hypothetical protein E0L32_011044 [Thyridium curvatum]